MYKVLSVTQKQLDYTTISINSYSQKYIFLYFFSKYYNRHTNNNKHVVTCTKCKTDIMPHTQQPTHTWRNNLIRRTLTSRWRLLIRGCGRRRCTRLLGNRRAQVLHQLFLLGLACEAEIVDLWLELHQQQGQIVVELRENNKQIAAMH